MASITNYGELKEEVANELNRSNRTDEIPGWIQRVEGFVNRKFRLPSMEAIDTGSLSTSTLALPTRYLETITLLVNDGSNYQELARNPLAIVRYKQGDAGEVPKYWVERDEEIIVAPGPDSTYTYEHHFYQGFASFSDDTDTNWVLTNAPDLYLAGALFHANNFIKDTEEAAKWGGIFNSLVADLESYQDSRNYPGGSLQVICR